MESGADRASEIRALGRAHSGARLRERNLNSLAWGVLVIASLLSGWAGFSAWQRAHEHARSQFEARADALTIAVTTQMNAYEDTVRAAAAVLEGRPDIDRESFHTFVTRLQISERRGGVHGLGFARLVREQDRAAYLAAQRAIYGDAFAIQPVGERAEYVVLDLLYPESPPMRPLLGRDLLAEDARRKAVLAARDSGELTAAPLVALADASRGGTGMAGFLLYAPVYARPALAQQGVNERRRELRGFATAGFGWQQVMREAIGDPDLAGFEVELLAGGEGGESVFRSGPSPQQRADAAARPAFAYARTLDLLGMRWLLKMQSPPLQQAVPGLTAIVLLPLVGFGLGLLLFLLLRNVARTERRSRALLDAVADHLPSLIAYIDGNGRYGFANRASRDWFGDAPAWINCPVETVHADDPEFLASLQRAMAECTPAHWAAWDAELGQPRRPVQLYLVPDVERDQRIAGWYLMANDISEQRQAHHELSLARDHLKRVTDRLPALILQFDAQERLVFFNRTSAADYVWDGPLRVGRHLRDIFGEEIYQRRRAHADWALNGRESDFEASFPAHGGPRRMHTFYTPDHDEDGRVCGFYVMAIDISEKARLEQALHKANELAYVTLTSVNEAVITIDVDARVTYMNPAAEVLTGLRLEQALEQPLERVAPLAEVAAQDHATELELVAQPGDLALMRADGSHILVERSLSPIHDHDDRRMGSVMVLRDITEARALSSRMTYLAHHDSLTGLPNRLQLNETLGQLITQATNRGNGVAVLFLDLDLFKHVNDALGHHVGDDLLQQVARRIQRNVGNLGTVYRTGGDEFVVLLHNVITRDSVLQLADRLLAIGATPYAVSTHELHQAFSIGISLFPEDGYDAATLMMRADAAMYLAKRNGRNATRFYTRDLAASVDARIELENSLRRGLRNGDLLLHYQPQIDRRTGRIVGVEGLARWQRGDRLVLPGEFIPIAEETNLIVDIDRWAIQAACRQNRIWQQSGLPPIRVSVNVAAANFDTDDLVDTVKAALDDSGLAAEHLELEVTETTLMRDVQRSDRTLRALKALGVRIAIDDFGTGFSSLSYLGNYGFNVLKIDQSFVRDVTEPNQSAITRAIIGLGSQLQCRTIAEGVENTAQAAWLAANGCDELQGNLFSPPVPAPEFARMYARNRTWDIPQAPSSMQAHWS